MSQSADYDAPRCAAVLSIKGEHFRCDWPTDEHGRHDGWGHSNKTAEAVWDCYSRPIPPGQETPDA